MESHLNNRFGSSQRKIEGSFFGADISLQIPIKEITDENYTEISFKKEIEKITLAESQSSEGAAKTEKKSMFNQIVGKFHASASGYDEDDDFIDDSEAFEEFIPDDWTTSIGGFYINQGPLTYVKAEVPDLPSSDTVEADSDMKLHDVKSLQTDNQTTISKLSTVKHKKSHKLHHINNAIVTGELYEPEIAEKNITDAMTTAVTSQESLPKLDPLIVSTIKELCQFKATFSGSDVQNNDELCRLILQLCDRTIDLSKKSRSIIISYFTTELNVTRKTTIDLIKFGEKTILGKKISGCIDQLQQNFNAKLGEAGSKDFQLFKNFLLSESKLLGKLIKYVKRLHASTNTKDPFAEQHLIKFLTETVIPVFKTEHNAELIIDFLLTQTHLKNYRKLPVVSTAPPTVAPSHETLEDSTKKCLSEKSPKEVIPRPSPITESRSPNKVVECRFQFPRNVYKPISPPFNSAHQISPEKYASFYTPTLRPISNSPQSSSTAPPNYHNYFRPNDTYRMVHRGYYPPMDDKRGYVFSPPASTRLPPMPNPPPITYSQDQYPRQFPSSYESNPNYFSKS